MSDSIAEAGVEEANVEEVPAVQPVSIPEPGTDEADAFEQDTGAEEAEGEPEAEAEAEPEDADYEEIEFDFGGNKFAIDKNKNVDEVAGVLQEYAKNLEAGFTQKTQAVAEQRKSLEAQAEAVQAISTLNGESFELYNQASLVHKELAGYDNVNWGELWNEEPDRARELSDKRQWLQSEAQRLESQFQEKQQAMTQEQSRQRDRFIEEGKKQINSKIKGFESKAAQVVDYVVKTYGIPKERAEEWPLNPPGTEMAYKAMLYDEMNNSIKSSGKPKIKPAVPVPGAKTKSGNTQKPLSKMSMSEYVKARAAGRTE